MNTSAIPIAWHWLGSIKRFNDKSATVQNKSRHPYMVSHAHAFTESNLKHNTTTNSDYCTNVGFPVTQLLLHVTL